ncbi:MAG: hypothetical protein DHS80DRAFT_21240 [Piptocephalis tieghemiana]|nr:MAG: hypothetical protein DHS80DRAFT_21240 [Piptocephalis tieghemiana]
MPTRKRHPLPPPLVLPHRSASGSTHLSSDPCPWLTGLFPKSPGGPSPAASRHALVQSCAPTRKARNKRRPVTLEALRQHVSLTSPPATPLDPDHDISFSSLSTPSLADSSQTSLSSIWSEGDASCFDPPLSPISSTSFPSPIMDSEGNEEEALGYQGTQYEDVVAEIHSHLDACIQEDLYLSQSKERMTREERRKEKKREKRRQARRLQAQRTCDDAISSSSSSFPPPPLPQTFPQVLDECLNLLGSFEEERQCMASQVSGILDTAQLTVSGMSEESDELLTQLRSNHAELLWQEEKLGNLSLSLQSTSAELAALKASMLDEMYA